MMHQGCRRPTERTTMKNSTYNTELEWTSKISLCATCNNAGMSTAKGKVFHLNTGRMTGSGCTMESTILNVKETEYAC